MADEMYEVLQRGMKDPSSFPAPPIAKVIGWKMTAMSPGRATMERGSLVPAIRLGSVPGFETMVAAFATDIPELTRWGTPYLYGPGSIHVAHTKDERITRAELEAAVAGYVKLAMAALAEAANRQGVIG